MWKIVVKTLFLFAFVNFYAKADADEDLKQQFLDTFLKCSQEFPLTAAEIEMLKDKKLGDSENIKCMFACTYKRTGMMNDKGELSVEGVKNMSKKYFANDPEKTKMAMEYADACKSVNDVNVNDGEKGCERAGLIFTCTIEKAADFDFSD